MEGSLESGNMTRVQEFVLLGLSTKRDIRDVLFAVFLTLYVLTLLENMLIIYLICSHSELYKPMYFFLGNLSCLEMCYVSVTMPSLLVGLRTGPYHISFTACMTQLFFFIVLICTECTLLASMAYDRYVIICRPLHYPLLTRPQVCLGLALSSWLGGLLVSVAKTTCIASLSYCSPNILNQFFCDVSPLLNLSCTHVALTELVDFISAIVIFCGTLLVALASYSAIMVAVLRMLSAAARRKAFSTCASHLIVWASSTLQPSSSTAAPAESNPWTSTRCCLSSTRWSRPCATPSSTACGTGRSTQRCRELSTHAGSLQ